MKKLFATLIFPLIISSTHIAAEIRVIMTSAILNIDYERRKEEYIRGLDTMRAYGFEPWIVEATNINSSFYDNLTHQVVYPQAHRTARNKGVNEVLSIRRSLPHLAFDDEDMVIKLTGRYWLYQRDFIDIVESTINDFDAYAYPRDGKIFTGCFAMRWKYFKQIINAIDLEKMEREMICVEDLIAEFIKNQGLRTRHIDTLFIEARSFGDINNLNAIERI